MIGRSFLADAENKNYFKKDILVEGTIEEKGI